MKRKAICFMFVAIAMFLIVQPSHALFLEFSGEDLGLGENTPLSSWPNAEAAETSFLSNLVGVGTEDFEGIATNTYTPLYLTFPGAGTATLTGDSYTNVSTVPTGSTNGVGRYAISGNNYLEASTDGFTIDFDQDIAAFGFYGVDLGDFEGQVSLVLTDGTTTNVDIPHTVGAPGGSVIYYGFIDTENLYTRIEFTNTGLYGDYFGFDDMTIGSRQQVSVPDASIMLLLSSSLMGLGVFGRKYKRS